MYIVYDRSGGLRIASKEIPHGSPTLNPNNEHAKSLARFSRSVGFSPKSAMPSGLEAASRIMVCVVPCVRQ